MAAGQVGWWAIGAAFVGATATIVDRLIRRWRPRPRVTRLDERTELAQEWREYREAIDRQLTDCRDESKALRSQVTELQERNFDLRAEVASLDVKVRILEARLGDQAG